MAFSYRSKASTLLSLIALVTLISVFFPGRTTYAASTTHSRSAASGTASTAVKVGTVDPLKLPRVSSAPAHISPFPYRPIYSGRERNAGISPAKSVVLQGITHVEPNTLGAPVLNFNGVSNTDSKSTTGSSIDFPDEGLCVSKNFAVEPVNWAMTIYSHAGQKIAGPMNLISFFKESSPLAIGQSHCYFDVSTNAWFAIITVIDSSTASHYDIAVNPSGNPTTPWVIYKIETTDAQHSGCPCFGELPALGADQYNIYVTTNEVSISTGSFLGTWVYAFAKSVMIPLPTNISWVYWTYTQTMINGKPTFGIQPAVSIGSPNAEYLLSSFATVSSSNQLTIWAITNTQAVATGPASSVLLQGSSFTTQGYSPPPSAMTTNSNLLSTDGDNLQQVEFINGELWGALDTFFSSCGTDKNVRSGVEWFIIRPSVDSSGAPSAIIRDQNGICAPDNYLLYPAIEATPNGTAVLVTTLSGRHINPSVVYFVRRALNRGEFDLTYIAPALGEAGYNCSSPSNGACRWGDYSTAVLDPSNGGKTVWMASEYIPDKGSEVPNWGTRIVEVQMA
jgi:hypothetical protein